MKLTKLSAVEQMTEAAHAAKSLFPADATARDGSFHHANIDQMLEDAIGEFDTYPKFSNHAPWLEGRVSRFAGEMNTFNRIAARHARKAMNA